MVANQKMITASDADEDNKKSQEIEESNVSSTSGMIVNLMSTDSHPVSDFASWWFIIIQAPFEILIGVYFLFNLLG